MSQHQWSVTATGKGENPGSTTIEKAPHTSPLFLTRHRSIPYTERSTTCCSEIGPIHLRRLKRISSKVTTEKADGARPVLSRSTVSCAHSTQWIYLMSFGIHSRVPAMILVTSPNSIPQCRKRQSISSYHRQSRTPSHNRAAPRTPLASPHFGPLTTTDALSAKMCGLINLGSNS